MTDLQVFDMNPPLNFPISEKSIYQMGFNSTATQPPVPNYVHEPNSLTSHFQILDLLNPQNPSGNTDKKRQFVSDLMAPHYEKQVEIEKKIDDLSKIVNQFIKSQHDVNKLIIDRFLGAQEQCSSPITNVILDDNQMDEQEPLQNDEIEDKIERESAGQNETTVNQQTINNPMPLYPVPIPHDISTHSPIRNRSISPEKMETGQEMSVRDFLKTTMTVQKADEKILEEELERERDEAAQAVRYNKFRVRNRPKKYKRSAVTFTSSLEANASGGPPPETTSLSTHSTIGNPTESSQIMEQLDQSQNNSIEVEDNIFQPIVVPCVQRATELDLSLMPPVFPTTSSYVLNSALDTSSQNSLSALTESKFQTDHNNIWKAVDGVTQLLVDAPSLLDSDLRFPEHSHSFLPFVAHEPHHHRSAFVPPQYHKDRRIHQQMDPNLTDTLRSL